MRSEIPNGAQVHEELSRQFIGFRRQADCILDRATQKATPILPLVLQLKSSGNTITLVERYLDFDDVPGVAPSVRSVEFYDGRDIVIINFQRQDKFTALINSQSFLCTAQQIPDKPEEFRSAAIALMGFFSKVDHYFLKIEEEAKGVNMFIAPNNVRMEFNAHRDVSKGATKFDRQLDILKHVLGW